MPSEGVVHRVEQGHGEVVESPVRDASGSGGRPGLALTWTRRRKFSGALALSSTSPGESCTPAPSGFVEDVLGESLWSKQRAVLDAIVDQARRGPAGLGVGKTHLAARAAVWFANV